MSSASTMVFRRHVLNTSITMVRSMYAAAELFGSAQKVPTNLLIALRDAPEVLVIITDMRSNLRDVLEHHRFEIERHVLRSNIAFGVFSVGTTDKVDLLQALGWIEGEDVDTHNHLMLLVNLPTVPDVTLSYTELEAV